MKELTLYDRRQSSIQLLTMWIVELSAPAGSHPRRKRFASCVKENHNAKQTTCTRVSVLRVHARVLILIYDGRASHSFTAMAVLMQRGGPRFPLTIGH